MQPFPRLAAAAVAALFAHVPAVLSVEPPAYPQAPKGDVVDTYHGVKVADPFRGLEDADAAQTVAWVDAQNALTRSMLDRPQRAALRTRLEQLFDYPRLSAPERQGDRLFYFRNTGLQNQAVMFVKEKGVERVLLDPNTLSADGTVALGSTTPTNDGTLLGYTISRSGSDRQEILVRDVATGKDLPDRLQWAKFTDTTWTPDNKGFYYTRFPQPGTVPAGDENYFAKIYFHRLGEPQTKDDLVFETPDRKDVVWVPNVTLDGR